MLFPSSSHSSETRLGLEAERFGQSDQEMALRQKAETGGRYWVMDDVTNPIVQPGLEPSFWQVLSRRRN